jgi:3,4-dihydroxy-2-butanone 4-phosphate synthase
VRLIGRGKMIIVIDDEDRENEGDVVFSAAKATPALVNFALKHGRGILCAPMAPEAADRLGLQLMVERNTAKFGTPFTESVDARRGTTTGTSAFDRWRTLRALADPKTRSEDLLRPGHVFPLRAVPGGVLRRAGHTEAVPDLCRLAGAPAGRRAVRGADRGRSHGAPAAARAVRAQAQARHPHDQGPHRVPPPPRAAPRRAHRDRAAADPARRLQARAVRVAARRRSPRGARQG